MRERFVDLDSLVRKLFQKKESKLIGCITGEKSSINVFLKNIIRRACQVQTDKNLLINGGAC